MPTYTGSHMTQRSAEGDRDHFDGKHIPAKAECPHCIKSCPTCERS